MEKIQKPYIKERRQKTNGRDELEKVVKTYYRNKKQRRQVPDLRRGRHRYNEEG